MTLENLTIVGPGALGILFAARIWHRFSSVSLLHHDKKKAIRLAQKGVKVVEPASKEEVVAFPTVTADVEEIGVQDAVMVLVKAFQTESVLSSLKKLCGPETLVVTLQNGIGPADILARAVQSKNLALGVTMHGANKRDDSTVVHAGIGDTIIGMFEPGAKQHRKLKSLSLLLGESGFSTQLVDDVYPVLWKKLMVNVGINALTALSGLRNGQLLEHAELLTIQQDAVSEAFEVMKGLGIGLNMDFQEILALVRKVCRDTSQNISSMLQDRMKKRRTEIEYINGAVVRFAGEIGKDAPVNNVLVRLVEYFTKRGWNLDAVGS